MVGKTISVILCTIVMFILSTKLVNSQYESRIVGGSPANISSRPFQVAVLPGDYLCGGSLIKYNAVLTAAHCVVNIPASRITVRAGSKYYEKGGVVSRVIQKYVNRFFDSKTMNRDIAILKIRTFRPFMARYSIATISLANFLPPAGTSVVVSGYGTLRSGGSLASNLQQATLEITNKKYCNKQYKNALTTSMFCAAASGKDSCQGDAGGPVTYNGTLIGVISWGIGCADSRYPSVYTSVPMLKPWINSILRINF